MGQFIKRSIYIGAREIAAIQIGKAFQTQGTRSDGRPVLQTLAELMSYRSTNPLDAAGNPQEVRWYLTITTENLRFSPLRFTEVVGLDVDEHGAELTLPVLMARMGEDIAARQLANIENQRAPIVSLADALDAVGDEDDSDSEDLLPPLDEPSDTEHVTA